MTQAQHTPGIISQLTEAQLSLACMDNGVPATRENMMMMAFFNDADFRQRVTRFYFDRASAIAKAKAGV